MRALRTVGVPYTDEDIAGGRGRVNGKTEQDALIAYLQDLGTAAQGKVSIAMDINILRIAVTVLSLRRPSWASSCWAYAAPQRGALRRSGAACRSTDDEQDARQP